MNEPELRCVHGNDAEACKRCRAEEHAFFWIVIASTIVFFTLVCAYLTLRGAR